MGKRHPNLSQALEEIRKGKQSYRGAAKKWGIGKKVLETYMNPAKQENKNHGCCLFTSQEEEVLVETVQVC